MRDHCSRAFILPQAGEATVKWSLRIARVGQVSISVHGAFLLLLGWEVVSGLLDSPADQRGWQALREGLYVLTVLVLLLLHELGHLLAASWCGITTREILLLPLGGIARLDRAPAGVGQEVLVALAGPLVNLLLAGALLGGLVLVHQPFDPRHLSIVSGDYLTRLFWINIALTGCNMLPALPLDGGRVLRAILARKGDQSQANQTALVLGQGLALLAGFVGLLAGDALLLFLALCVWIGAGQDASQVQHALPLASLSVRQAMICDFRTLRPDDSLAVAIGHVLAGFPHDFPVEQEGRLVGMLPRGDLLTALARQGETAKVSEIMRRDYPTATPSQSLQEVLEQFQDSDYQALPVLENGKIVGLLTMDAVGELLALRLS
jgi:Zn-dependent protease/CBS domain-containing protein